MKNITLDVSKAVQFLKEGTVKNYEAKVKEAQEALENGTCPGNDFLGWLHLPSSITPEFLKEIQDCANTLRENCEAIVVAGIGGSYLGARAVIEALSNSFSWLIGDKSNPTILFAGNNIGEDYLYELTEYLKNKKFGVINISKSGTTTETALTFRLLKKQCEEQRGKEEAKKVIVAVTDATKGAARAAADKEGYKTFVIPDNVGGRFSVLTPVGLLPIACAGFDITKLVEGAADMEKACGKDVAYEENPAAVYAAIKMGESLPNKPYINFFTRPQVVDLMSEADLYVHAAVADLESISCLEAICCGALPLLSDSPKAAVSEYSRNTHCVFKCGDDEDLAKHIDWFIEHPEESAQIKTLYNDFYKNYNFEHCMDRMEQMIKDAYRYHTEGHKKPIDLGE